MNADTTSDGAKRDPQTFEIIGAAMAVHSELGPGFLEGVYQEALELEFRLRKLEFEREKQISINYKGQSLAGAYRADFVCFNTIIVELKAADKLTGVHKAQVINYLKATNLRRALLINFGSTKLEYERVVRNYRS